MTDIKPLNRKYSTTRLLINEVSDTIDYCEDIGKNSEYHGGLRTKGYFKKSYPNKPLVSVITIVFNGDQYLEETINSVINQTYDNVEYIVIDGGSTDGTLQIIKKYEDKIDYWLSEKDRGIYDAWNKGLKLATGDIIGFANADDFYDLNAIEIIVPSYAANKFQLTYGVTQFIRDEVCAGVNNRSFNQEEIYSGFGFMHTTVFTTREVYQKVGYFDDSFRIAGDAEWLTRAYKEGIVFKQLNNLTYMREGGVSHKFESQAFREFHQALSKHGFDRKKLRKAMLKRKVITMIARIVGEKNKSFLRQQINLIILKAYNIIYNLLPFFVLKKKWLRLFSIELGQSSYIHTPVRLFSKGRINVGDNSTINHNCFLDNRGKIKIGNNVSIAHATRIYTAGHEIHNPCFTYKVKDVEIGDNVVVFSNVLIMPGVKINNNAVILPGSVVVKNVDEFSIVGGNPAKHIEFRKCGDIKYKIDYSYWFAQ